MDRKGHIREKELTKVYDYDRKFGEEIDKMKTIVDKVMDGVEEQEWATIRKDVKSIRDLLEDIETRWARREDQFRSLEI
jgi:septation ring formation regulator EzrA